MVPPIFVADPTIRAATSLSSSPGFAARISAASPATSGVAMEVPLQAAYPPPGTLLSMASPGPATLTQDPKLKQSARMSPGVVAPTEITRGKPVPAGYSGVELL